MYYTWQLTWMTLNNRKVTFNKGADAAAFKSEATTSICALRNVERWFDAESVFEIANGAHRKLKGAFAVSQ